MKILNLYLRYIHIFFTFFPHGEMWEMAVRPKWGLIFEMLKKKYSVTNSSSSSTLRLCNSAATVFFNVCFKTFVESFK